VSERLPADSGSLTHSFYLIFDLEGSEALMVENLAYFAAIEFEMRVSEVDKTDDSC